MRLRNIIFILFVFALLASQPLWVSSSVSAAVRLQPYFAPSPYDLINKVNEWRLKSGLSALQANNFLMLAAQRHSEYQAALGTWSHTGPGGSNETDRAIAAGYGGGVRVICDEAVAIGSTSMTLDYIVYTMWDDHDHRDLVLLNSRYVDAGGGVVEKNGRIYYTLDVCVTTGGTVQTPRPLVTSIPGATSVFSPQPFVTQAPPMTATPLLTSTPLESGALYHIVQPGQTPWDVAIAYGIKVIDLATMNGLSPSNPIIYPGQKLLIRGSYTPTVSPTVTATPRPPTRTPRPPTATLRAPLTRTPTPEISPTPEPVSSELQMPDRRTIGLVIVVVCVLGLVLVMIIRPGKK